MGSPSMPAYQPPKPRVVEPGPESPNDKVNNQEVENITDRSKQNERRGANRGPTATAQSNKGYGGTTKQQGRAPGGH